MKKAEITFYYDVTAFGSRSGEGYPAINVKDHSTPYYSVKPYFSSLTSDEFKELLQQAYDRHVEMFWSDAESICESMYGITATIQQAGRSGGWLLLVSEGDAENVLQHWNAVKVSKWSLFVRRIDSLMTHYTDAYNLAVTMDEMRGGTGFPVKG